MFVQSIFVLVGAVSVLISSSCVSEPLMFDLDEYGRMDREDFMEIIRPHYGSMVFIRGRITVNQISYPDASHFPEGADAEVYPCTNNPFDVPIDEYPTHERVRAGLVPAPWFFNSKFVAESKEPVNSVNMDISYQSYSPVNEFALSEIHMKCVTMLVKLTGEMDIASITTAGTLYIHNVYDTESSLGME